jgi:hypothetical protein
LAHYLAAIREPSAIVDERVRHGINTLSLLLGERDASLGQSGEIPPDLPTNLNDFLPPRSILALPVMLERLLTDSVVRGLDLSTSWVERIKRAFRWANFHDGDPVSPRELFNMSQELRALTHFVLMTKLGFAPAFALARLKGRWRVL